MAPFVIPFFITHEGCPHQCIFCNQHDITGTEKDRGDLTPDDVTSEIETWLSRPRKNPDSMVQVAFYGGSFTCLDHARQRELLAAVNPFLNQQRVNGIRLSTRPDCIDEERVRFLKDNGVVTVELGVQSMDQRVLDAAGRGHTVAQTVKAVKILGAAGMEVGAQLMIGLPEEKTAGLFSGAAKLIALRPDFVRIYPTLVFAGSPLAQLYADKRYHPLSLHRAIAMAVRLKLMFETASIRVVRVGLQAGESIAQHYIAGPYHPSFGELVLARIFFRKTRSLLAPRKSGGIIHVAHADESIFRGPENRNLGRLRGLGLLDAWDVIYDPAQSRRTLRLSVGDPIQLETYTC